ncbi:MAG: hypothetical protein M3464_06115 [Chloroflexota bacterium]|nr:hypothetical protein [Chloroflexota bacterium]
MTRHPFDLMSRRVASLAPTRRGVLRLIAGSTLAAAVPWLAIGGVEAAPIACKKVGDRCRGKQDKKTCRVHNVGTCKPGPSFCQIGNDAVCGDLCFCFTTTGNAHFCGKQVRGVECQRDAECVALGFPAGSACAKNNGRVCEIETSTFCVSPCLGPQPL